jgi:type I restriction enzyme S subunit
MPILRDAIGKTGIMKDGDWILSKNMDPRGQIGLIQLKHIGVGKFEKKRFNFISEDTFKELNCTEVFPGDVLISRMADPIARACIVPALPFRCITAVDVTILRVDKDVADNKFVQYLCNSEVIQVQAERVVRGTTRARITRKELESLSIPLPPLPEQKRIAAMLSQADRLRHQRRYARKLNDTFLQSIFLEMFFKQRETSWPELTIASVAKPGKGTIRTGPFGSQLRHSEFVDTGILVLGIDNAVNNHFEWGKPRFITEEKYQQLKRYTVFPGDVIITIMATTGRCAIIPEDIPTTINTKHLCCITLNTARCLPTYLKHCFLTHPHVLRQLGVSERGAIMPGLNMGIIKKLVIPIPPISLQEKFEMIVKRYECLRIQQEEGSRKSEQLFQSLLYGAFRGVFWDM